MATPRHFLELKDVPADTLKAIIKNAHALKKQKMSPPQIFSGLSLAMMFDKRSTRTRISFEVAMKQLGGHTLVMDMDKMVVSGAESVEDTSKVMSRFVDCVMIRVSDHAFLTEFAKYSDIPVINGMTDQSHPCQLMADMMTIEEKLGSVKGKNISWFGDINNMTRTFIQASSIWEFNLTISCPADIKPKDLPAHIKYVESAAEAAKTADVLVTDTWVSMGQEGKAIDKFFPWQVNKTLMAKAKPGAIFMHCMAVHRNEEVTDEVLATPASVIYDEAENRLHAQKAILAWCLENSGVKV